MKGDADGIGLSEEGAADANVELKKAQHHEQTLLRLPEDITLKPDGSYYSLGEPTPAMKAAAAYARAYEAENCDPALRPVIDRRALAVLQAEMKRVEESTVLSPLQKAVYFEAAAELLGPAHRREAQTLAAKYYAEMAGKAEATDAALAGAQRAVRLANAVGVNPELRELLQGAEKNLGVLAAKAKGEQRADLLHTQAQVDGRLAAASEDPKEKKALYTKAAKLAEDAAGLAPAISARRAEALESAASYQSILGNRDKAKELHGKAAAAFEALAKAAAGEKKYDAASDAYAKAGEEYRKIGRDGEAAGADEKSLEYSNRATQAQLAALAPPAFKGDPKTPVTGEQIAAFDAAKLPKGVKGYKAGAKAFAEMAEAATDPGAKEYYQAAARRYSALAEMSAHLPKGAAPLAQPPSKQNLEDYAKQVKADVIATFKARNGGEAPGDAYVANQVAQRLSRVLKAFYVHQNDRGGPIDRAGGSNNVGAGPDGRVMVDCVTCSLDLATAMSAAGFKLRSVGAARDKEHGAGHIMLEVQSKDGTPLGYFNNTDYQAYSSSSAAPGELDAAFRETIGSDPPFTTTSHDPEKDPARKTGVPR